MDIMATRLRVAAITKKYMKEQIESKQNTLDYEKNTRFY